MKGSSRKNMQVTGNSKQASHKTGELEHGHTPYDPAEGTLKKDDMSHMIDFSLLKMVIDTVAEGIFVKDRKARYILVNRSGLELFHKLHEKDIIGKTIAELIPDDYARQLFEEDIEILRTGKPVHAQERVLDTPGGKEIRLITKIPLRDCDGSVTGLVEITRDISTMRKYEEALKQAKDDAEVAHMSRLAFLSNMSNELRSPLTSVIAMSDILLRKFFGDLNDQQEEYIKDIKASGEHLLSLIDDVLDLSEIESGNSPLKLSKVNLPDLLENCLEIIRGRAVKYQIELSSRISSDVYTITVDERKVKQVVCHLLSNAVKFTPDGGRVGIEADRLEHGLRVCVWDTGIGISGEDAEKIFIEFVQADTSSSKKNEGAGLGLTLVKRFIEQHGGRVWLESEPGKGSRFYFVLPFEPPGSDTDKKTITGQARPE